MRNTCVIFRFGLVRSLASLHKSFDSNAVHNQVELEVLRQLLNAGISVELWGQHGVWDLFKSQKRYMKIDVKSILPVSLASMDQPSTSKADISLEENIDIRNDSGVSDTTDVGDDYIPFTDGIPFNVGRWHGETS